MDRQEAINELNRRLDDLDYSEPSAADYAADLVHAIRLLEAGQDVEEVMSNV